jgi:hypothetical protein
MARPWGVPSSSGAPNSRYRPIRLLRRETARGHQGQLAHVVHRRAGEGGLGNGQLVLEVGKVVALQADHVGLRVPQRLAELLAPEQQHAALLFERHPARPGRNAGAHVTSGHVERGEIGLDRLQVGGNGAVLQLGRSQPAACPGQLGLRVLDVGLRGNDRHDDLGLSKGQVGRVAQVHRLLVQPVGLGPELVGALPRDLGQVGRGTTVLRGICHGAASQ